VKKAGVIFFVLVIILTITLRVDYLLSPVNINNDNYIYINIEAGSSGMSIAKELYDNGLIHSKLVFNLLVVLSGLDDELKAGYYKFFYSDSIWQIISKLSKGKIVTFKLTIPEGFTFKEIIERLSIKTDYTEEDFLFASDRLDHNILKFITEKEYKYKLEGFLYPDTYIIPLNFNAEEILTVFLDHFGSKWKKKLLLKLEDSNYDIFEIIILASLIEKEAKLDEEKSIVSSVINNRLDKNMLLQIDASIQYALEDRKDRILYSDLNIDSHYNTYKYYGLPPGPICNPGDLAIEAALNPADSDYLFYFAVDGGKHIFSKSYSEHIRLQLKYKEKKD